jgi:hypothetical protein
MTKSPSPTPGQQDEIVEAIADGLAWEREERGNPCTLPTQILVNRLVTALQVTQALLAHLPTPPGRWVPLEPTEAMMAMIEAAVNTCMYADTPEELASEIYRAMLEAAPAGGGER